MRILRLLFPVCKRCNTAIKTLALFSAISVSATASAGRVTGGTIIQIQIATQANGAFISLDVAKTLNPACSTDPNWGFFLPLTTSLGNQMLALILAAHAANAPVTLIGSGLCDAWGGVETLQYAIY